MLTSRLCNLRFIRRSLCWLEQRHLSTSVTSGLACSNTNRRPRHPGSAGGERCTVGAATQISSLCHLAIGWRTDCIIELQCWSSKVSSFPTVNCPIRTFVDFLLLLVLYTETKILHCSRGNCGSENMTTSLKTVTRHSATALVFWYLSLHWLHCTLILANRAAQ